MSLSRAFAALAVLAAAAAPAVRAGLAVGSPYSATVAQAGQPLNVSWYNDDQCPEYSFEDVAKYPVNIDLCVKDGVEIVSLKNLSTYINVTQQSHAVSEPIDASLGPESSQYFVRILSTGLTDNSTCNNWATYSANFTIKGMTGTFPHGIQAGTLNPGDNHTRYWDHECSCHKHGDTGEVDKTPSPIAVQPDQEPSSSAAAAPAQTKTGANAIASASSEVVAGVVNPTATGVANGSAPTAVPQIVTMTDHKGSTVTVTSSCGCSDDLKHTVPASQSLTTTVITQTDGPASTITIPCPEETKVPNAGGDPSFNGGPAAPATTPGPATSSAGNANAVAPGSPSSSTVVVTTQPDGTVQTTTVPCPDEASGGQAAPTSISAGGPNAIASGSPTPSSTTTVVTQNDGTVETKTVPRPDEAPGGQAGPTSISAGGPNAVASGVVPSSTTTVVTQSDGTVETKTVPCPEESSGGVASPTSLYNNVQSGAAALQETSTYATTNGSYTGMVTVTKPCTACQHGNAALPTGAFGANSAGVNSTGHTNGTDWGKMINSALNGEAARTGSPLMNLLSGLVAVGAGMTLLA